MTAAEQPDTVGGAAGLAAADGVTKILSPLPAATPTDLSQLAHRRVIGFLGLFLTPTLFLVSAARPTSKHLESLSAYYYSGAVAVLVGVLFSLGLFLVTYRGYADFIWDRVVGFIGGIAAICVALFPTQEPPDIPRLGWWTEPTKYVHYGSAFTLFGCFILFALWLFRRSSKPPGQRPTEKRVRNGVFLACGLIMVASVGWATYALSTGAPIVWPESFAVWAFAISWLVKGEIHRPIVEAVQRRLGSTKGNP